MGDTELLKAICQKILQNHLPIEQLKIILECFLGEFSVVYTFVAKENTEIGVIKDRFGKRSLLFTAGQSNNKDNDESYNWICFSSSNILNIDQMAKDRELTLPQAKYFEDLEVDELIDPEVLTKHSQLVEKIRNGIKDKFFDNLKKILKKWSCEVPGNTFIKLKSTKNGDFISSIGPLSTKYDDLCYSQQEIIASSSELDSYESFENKLTELLDSSLKNIIINLPEEPFTRPLLPDGYSYTESNLGILFSGGLDSTLLAALAAKNYPENRTIDLYNISFLNGEQEIWTKMTFDRECAINSYKNLEEVFPGRFNLILIDHVYDTIYSSRTMSEVTPDIKINLLNYKINPILATLGEKGVTLE